MPVNILGLVFTVRSLIAGMYKLQCIDPVDSGDRVCPLRQILAWGGVAGLHVKNGRCKANSPWQFCI